MITKIDSLSPISNRQKLSKVNSQPKAQNVISQNLTELMGYQAANALKAQSTLNFKGESLALSPLERSIIGDKEIRIENLFALTPNDRINLPFRKMPADSRKYNTAGLNITSVDSEGSRAYEISNDLGNTIAVAKFDLSKGIENLPVITYKQGKFMPEITVKDPSLNGKSIKMLSGSILKGDGFEVAMPGKYEPRPSKGFREINFRGRVVITTLNKEPRTINAVDKYKHSGLQAQTTKGDYYDEVVANDPTIVCPAGGFGERLYNITRDDENKPSAKLPTHDDYRIIATTLNMGASAGILTGNNDDIRYLSQNHEIEAKSGKIYHTRKYSSDGGAIAEGLTRDIIRNDKDIIILNADIFTNADISRIYHALKTLPDAALVIPYYPVNPERAKSFGLLGIEKDENNNLQIKSFLEKPKYTKNPPQPQDFRTQDEYDAAMHDWETVQTAAHPNNDSVYLANPGMYFMTPQAMKVLMAKGIVDPKSTGLGAHVMPEVVRLANEGKLVDENGRNLKVYTVPLEAKGGKPAVWDDIGTAEAYLTLIKDVAREVDEHSTGEDNKYYGVPEFVLNDFRSNVDLRSGIVYDSAQAKSSLRSFKQKYDVKKICGNIFVAGNK